MPEVPVDGIEIDVPQGATVLQVLIANPLNPNIPGLMAIGVQPARAAE